jgi:hypothetical protein
MDSSRAPRPTARLTLDICRDPDGRIEGRLRAEGTDSWEPFSGVLELLKVLEEHT